MPPKEVKAVKRTAEQINYRKLQGMLIDLKKINAELSPDTKNGGATAEEMKNFDDFQRKKHALTVKVAAVRENVDKLVALRKELGDNARDTKTIKLQQDNSAELKAAFEDWKALQAQWVKDCGRKKKKLSEKELEDRNKATSLLGNEIKELSEKNSRVAAVVAPENLTRREKRTQKKLEDRQKRNRAGTRTRKNGAGGDEKDVDLDSDDEFRNVGPTTKQEQQFQEQVDKNREEENKMLDELSAGIDQLGVMATDINKTLRLQNAMLTEIEDKMDDTIVQFQSANARLKQVLDDSGGVATWCPRLICFIVLIALVGYILNAMSTS